MGRRIAAAAVMLGKRADQRRLDAKRKPAPPARMPIDVVPDDDA